MEGVGAGLLVEELGLLRWLRQYVRLRWLAVVVVLLGTLVARFALGVGVPLLPVMSVTAAIACYNAIFTIWQQRHKRYDGAGAWKPVARARWDRRFAFAQVVADLMALTLLLHFIGGIETPFFLFYLLHVGFGSIMLSRRDAYMLTGLAIVLFLLLVVTEFLGWLPHVHLEGFVSPGLYRERAYVASVLGCFVATLVISSVGATTGVAQLRHQWERQARARERELEAIKETLAELDRMRDFFLGLASHDLKTPLAVVSNYLQTILDGFAGEVNEKQRRWMERANVRILELIRLINDFLDISQLAPERILAEMRPTALSDAVQRSVEEVRPRAEEKGITLRLELPPQLPPVRAADRRLQQVITNLLDNAIKCSPRQGQVMLEVRELRDGVQVDVLDAGPSIPVHYMPHVFEDYFQVQRKEFVPGAGLGLSIARKIVEAHGGEIWVESPCFEEGGGSRFSFTLQITRWGG